MLNLFYAFATAMCLLSHSFVFGGCCGGKCCQSVDIEVGWRRDSLDWKTTMTNSECFCANVNDDILFKNIDSYTISGQFKWVASQYYIRASAQYGLSDKGREYEHFRIHSSELYDPINIHRSNPVKRRSEVYDFDAAIGYPLSFCCSRLSVIPLVGFSFHRQHIRTKNPRTSSSCPEAVDCCNFFRCHSSSSFFVEDPNAFVDDPTSNPFGCSSSSRIASRLGLCNPHRTDNFRFTWFGFYLGADFAYALDPCWTLFWETEFHLFDRCNRKRKSWTGVCIVDHYHKKGFAYGFDNIFGLNYTMGNCWYATLSIDFDWWKAPSHHDDLQWKKVGAKLGLVYSF